MHNHNYYGTTVTTHAALQVSLVLLLLHLALEPQLLTQPVSLGSVVLQLAPTPVQLQLERGQLCLVAHSRVLPLRAQPFPVPALGIEVVLVGLELREEERCEL